MTPPLNAIRALTGGDNHAVQILTSAHDGTRSGAIALSVQLSALDPLLVSVALRRGHPIEPLIRDSRSFAICRVSADEKLLVRKFGEHAPPDEPDDPFDSLPTLTLETGSPVVKRAVAALDCEVVRHLDLEADHELFVGLVRAAYPEPIDHQPEAGT
ncbi:MAG: flavin reductase family protein [Planctomycetota bacterium]